MQENALESLAGIHSVRNCDANKVGHLEKAHKNVSP